MLALVLLALTTGSCARKATGPEGNPWRFLRGHIEQLRYQPFRNGRECWVYLPPGYSQSRRRFPVIYFHDGEMMFADRPGAVHLDRILEELIRGGEMEPVIAVAIRNDGHRTWDYTPWPELRPTYLGPSGGGDLYLLAIRDTLKPEIDRRYRTLADPANTAIAGWSLGGLISAYAGFAYDSTFGKIGAISPSYWWTDYRIHDFARSRGRRGIARYYQGTGSDDNSIGGFAGLLLELGFLPGIDLMSVTVDGASHETTAYQHRMPGMMRFLFPPKRP